MSNVLKLNNGKTIIIDTMHKTLEVVAPGNINYAVNLTFNKNDVIRINKKSISTCNIEMFEYTLMHNNVAANNVAWFITGIDNTTGYKLSKSAFYAMFNDDLNALVLFFNAASHETRQLIIFDHCCTNHNAKMSGMISYSTYVKMNIYCIARRKRGCSVCAHCFAARQTKTYKEQALKLARTHVIATCCVWSIDDIPVDMIVSGGYKYFRLESFGDINNTTQVNNYNVLAIALKAVNIRVTLWTKNPGIIQKAINDGMLLSDNLTISLSSLKLNTPEIENAKKYSFVKFVFTVFDQEHVKTHNININCGGRHCLSCLNCYEHAAASDELIIINELLK